MEIIILQEVAGGFVAKGSKSQEDVALIQKDFSDEFERMLRNAGIKVVRRPLQKANKKRTPQPRRGKIKPPQRESKGETQEGLE